MKSDHGYLYIEPQEAPSPEPIIDTLTKKMAAAFLKATPGPGYRGVHRCSCGICSSNCDYALPNGEQTNSLSVHYLAYHRQEVPKAQLEKVAALNFGETVHNHNLLNLL